MVDRLGNVQEVLDELACHGLIRGVLDGQLQRNAEEVEAVHRHPARTVRLVDVAADAGGDVAAVEHADVVEAEKATLEDVVAGPILAVHPPGEVER